MSAKSGRRWRWDSVVVATGASPSDGPDAMRYRNEKGWTADHLNGLAITRGRGGYEGEWVITVAVNGFKLPGSFTSRAEAARIAEKLGAIGDWDRSVASLRGDSDLRDAAMRIVDDWFGDSLPASRPPLPTGGETR